MSSLVQGGLPPGLELGSGCTVEFHAVNPTTNNDVSGVDFYNVTIWAEGDVGDQSGAFTVGPFMLVPGPGA